MYHPLICLSEQHPSRYASVVSMVREMYTGTCMQEIIIVIKTGVLFFPILKLNAEMKKALSDILTTFSYNTNKGLF